MPKHTSFGFIDNSERNALIAIVIMWAAFICLCAYQFN
jgi:hypothetical protein